MPRQSCLTPDELKAFTLGQLSEPILDEIGAHVESCPSCEAALRALDAVSDRVVAAYREAGSAAPLSGPAEAPRRVGEYEILEELGRGGMGIVYKARHGKLQRIVALKMLQGGSFITNEERTRFRTEAEAIARLHHPHIVQIYEIGEHDVDVGVSWPYFTLEYAAGGNLSRRLAGRPQPPRQAAAWLEVLARTAHYAHQQGIIHRDLKPSNVLLTETDEPTICDFGVAKLATGSDMKTRSGTLLGTAEYMGPEQATGGEPIGPAADIYALGAILYTMLTGRPPFQGSNTLLILELVRSQEPVSPRRLVPQVPRDLETICLKCLEKVPPHRYTSAAELADDLRRFLADEPIRARPASAWERGWKWAKRRPTVAGLLATVVTLALVGVALVVGLWRGAEARAQLETDKAKEEARGRQENLRLLANVTLDHGLNLCALGEVNHGLLHLARAVQLAQEADAPELDRVARVNLAVWRRRIVTPRARLQHNDWVWAVAFSPDERMALTGGRDRVARRWNVITGRPIDPPLLHQYPVWAVAFSPDGKTILTGSGDDSKPVGEVRLWNAHTGEPLGPPFVHPDEVHVTAFSADGRRFLTACDQQVRVWHFVNGRPASIDLPHPLPARRLPGIQPRMWAVFSSDGETVLTGGEDGTARLWDAASGKQRGESLHHDGPILSLDFSSDGQTVATGSYDGTVRLWDVATCRQRGLDLPHHGRVHAVAIRFDGQFVATGSSVEDRDLRTGARTIVAGEVRLWHVPSGKLFGEPIRHSQPVWAVAFRSHGGKLLTGGRDRMARFYSLFDGALLGKPHHHEGTVAHVAFSPKGTLALTASAGGNDARARLWELAPGDPVVWSLAWCTDHGRQIPASAIAPDGQRMLGIAGNETREYDVVTGKPTGLVLSHKNAVQAAVYSADGQSIVTLDAPFGVHIWDRTGGRLIRSFPSTPLLTVHALITAGAYIAIIRLDGTVIVVNTQTGMPAGPVVRTPQILELTLRPDGSEFYTHRGGREVEQWDVKSGKPLRVWQVPGKVRFLRLVQGRPIAVTSAGDHLERAWDVETGRPISGPLADIAGQIHSFAFSADGRTFLTGWTDLRHARLWDTATARPIGPPVHHSGAVSSVAFTADQTRMLSVSSNAEFRSQEVPQPIPGDPERLRAWIEVLTGQALDAEGTIRVLDAAALQQRRQELSERGGAPDGRNPS
jgi:WD40 repeat protein/tRNA A-37 threonylcarbamoyl transferase component Bud32